MYVYILGRKLLLIVEILFPLCFKYIYSKCYLVILEYIILFLSFCESLGAMLNERY